LVYAAAFPQPPLFGAPHRPCRSFNMNLFFFSPCFFCCAGSFVECPFPPPIPTFPPPLSPSSIPPPFPVFPFPAILRKIIPWNTTIQFKTRLFFSPLFFSVPNFLGSFADDSSHPQGGLFFFFPMIPLLLNAGLACLCPHHSSIFLIFVVFFINKHPFLPQLSPEACPHNLRVCVCRTPPLLFFPPFYDKMNPKLPSPSFLRRPCCTMWTSSFCKSFPSLPPLFFFFFFVD